MMDLKYYMSNVPTVPASTNFVGDLFIVPIDRLYSEMQRRVLQYKLQSGKFESFFYLPWPDWPDKPCGPDSVQPWTRHLTRSCDLGQVTFGVTWDNLLDSSYMLAWTWFFFGDLPWYLLLWPRTRCIILLWWLVFLGKELYTWFGGWVTLDKAEFDCW